MIDLNRTSPCEAHEAKPAHDALFAEMGGEELLVAETVLEGDDPGGFPEEGGNEGRERGV
jgi:hypothetical protein